RDNRFCVACHLHDEKFMRLLVLPPKDLAGLHHERDPSVGCIACHGGHGTRMRMAVRTVAALDTLKFLAGAYREPTHMKLPLRDAECRPCHTPIVRRPRSEEYTSELQSRFDLVCRLLLEKKKKKLSDQPAKEIINIV